MSIGPLTLLAASAAAYALAVLSAVAGFGGGVLLLSVFTALFGLRVAVPVLTLTQITSNAFRVALNRHDLNWPLIGRFCLGAIPFAVAGAVLLAAAPLSQLQRLLGVFLIAVVIWRRLHPQPRPPRDACLLIKVGRGGLRRGRCGRTCRTGWRSRATA